MRFHRIASILLLLSCYGWAGTIPVANPSFESPNVSGMTCGLTGLPGCDYPHGSLGGWTFFGSSGIAANGSPFGVDTPGDGNAAPDGTQVAFLQYDPSNPLSSPGNISQSIGGLNAAQSYVLSFEAAQRPESLGPTGAFLFGGGLDFYVYWCPGGSSCSPIDFIEFDNQLPSYLSFAEYSTAPFTAGATSGLLEFQAYDPLSGDRSDFIDSVQLNDDIVPEPSNGLMVLSGIGMIGLGLRWRLVHSRSLPS